MHASEVDRTRAGNPYDPQICANRRIDARFLDVENAINDTVGYGMGTLLVFGSAEVIYYEGEEMGMPA